MTDEQTAERVKAIVTALEQQIAAFYASFGKGATISLLKGLLKAARKL